MRRFFCENCGEEVRERDELCPHCGAIFLAIKCPQCGYRGKQHEFGKGCPKCGFLGERHVRETTGDREPATDTGNRRQTTGRGQEEAHGAFPGKRASFAWLSRLTAKGSSGAGTPAWLFWFVLVVMVAAFVLLAVVYTRI